MVGYNWSSSDHQVRSSKLHFELGRWQLRVTLFIIPVYKASLILFLLGSATRPRTTRNVWTA